MALQQRDIRFDRYAGPGRPSGNGAGEPSLGELFGQLSSDAGRLIQQEVALAKAEIREAGSVVARDGAKIAMAAGLGLLAAIAGTAFLILALGDLLDNYWLSALIVTALLGGVAASMAKNALADLRRSRMKPEATIQTLREDADWARREAQEMTRSWKS